MSYDYFKELKSLAEKNDLDFPELLAAYSLHFGFFQTSAEEPSTAGMEELCAQILSEYKENEDLKPYEEMFRTLLSEMKTFPVPLSQSEGSGESPCEYEDTWGSARAYAGARAHEGTDIMDKNNDRGRLQVVSITDGEVLEFGWYELGGYHVGVKTENDTYYYYAHLDSFAPGMEKGIKVKAGQLLGFMGDSGYGREGTKGKFPVHLHVGICPDAAFAKEEFWINPYLFMRNLEDSMAPS
jgi:hypothetical protein